MRDYDPTTGRYLEADPLGLEAGVSLYGYALQNPGRFVNLTGENPVVVVVGAIEACFASAACTAGVAAIIGGGIVAQKTLPWIKNVPKTFEEGPCPEDCEPATAPFWNSLTPASGIYKKSGSGRKTIYYKWDYKHFCEVEVFDRHGVHLGAVDGRTGAPIKPPKPGRVEDALSR